jgi:hypothetical protein
VLRALEKRNHIAAPHSDISSLSGLTNMPQPMEFTPLGHQNHMITNNPPNPSVRGASTETTRFYMGSLMSFLVKSSQTRNGLCLLEYRTQPGHEPPPHIHRDQDEAFYLLEGELEVYCMG